MAWTDKRVETLKKLWNAGVSASEIAESLGGITRNAVIGKVHRLGLSGRATRVQKKRKVSKAKTPKTSRKKQEVKEDTKTWKPYVAPKEVQSQLEELRKHAEDVPLVQLEPGCCLWPTSNDDSGRHHFCGHPQVTDSAYCAEHKELGINGK
jgi:GcrA cell cycle regulator